MVGSVLVSPEKSFRVSTLVSVVYFVQGIIRRFRSDQVSDDCKILWDASWGVPLPGTKYVLKDVLTLPQDPLVDFQVDGDTIPLPLLHDMSQPVSMIELFSGACGGWKVASKFISMNSSVTFRTLSIDLDLDAAFAFAVANGIPLVSGMSWVDPALASKYKDLVVHADIAGNTWLGIASAWKPDVITISSPCQPWSSAGSASGIHSEMGQVLFKAIAACKLLRPRMIALEQVSAFMSHEHYGFLVQTLRWAGYSLHHSHVLDASDILPISRARWLAIALRVNDPVVMPVPFLHWTPQQGNVPNNWDMQLHPSLLQDERLYPDAETMKLSTRHDLLPPAKKRLVTKESVLASRCHDGSQKIPTLVASYGSQHKFSMAWLHEKGLMNHFVLDANMKPRYWHPFELWLMHGAYGSFFAFSTWDKTYRHLGNQICPVHALITLTNALRCMTKTSCDLDPTSLVSKFVQQRVIDQTLRCQDLGVGHLLSGHSINLTHDQICQVNLFHQGLIDETIPKGFLWTLDGFLPFAADETCVMATVPDTIPFTTFRTIHIHLNGMSFHLEVQNEIDNPDLLAIWGGAFKFLQSEEDDEKSILVLDEHWKTNNNRCRKFMLIQRGDTLFIANPTPQNLEWFSDQGHGLLLDFHGRLPDINNCVDHLLTCGFGISKVPKTSCRIAKYLLAVQKCRIHVKPNHSNLKMHIVIEGPKQYSQTIADFWTHLFLTDDLDAI
eukprot:s475_g16.t1